LLRQTHLKAIVLLKSHVRACAIRGFDEELLEPSLKVDAVPMHVPVKQAPTGSLGLAPRMASGSKANRCSQRRTVVRQGEPSFAAKDMRQLWNRRRAPRRAARRNDAGNRPAALCGQAAAAASMISATARGFDT
jgi:hypothetical protein